MKKSLFLCALLGTILLAGCSLTNQTKCPKWSEYWETRYDNWNLDAQWCFKIDSDEMEWHWTYYLENGWKDMEWDMLNDLEEWKWTFYDEDGNNIVVMEWTYKNGLEDGTWTYYYDDWTYLCSETFEEWEVIDEWDCPYDDEYEEEYYEEIEENDIEDAEEKE